MYVYMFTYISFMSLFRVKCLFIFLIFLKANSKCLFYFWMAFVEGLYCRVLLEIKYHEFYISPTWRTQQDHHGLVLFLYLWHAYVILPTKRIIININNILIVKFIKSSCGIHVFVTTPANIKKYGTK